MGLITGGGGEVTILPPTPESMAKAMFRKALAIKEPKTYHFYAKDSKDAFENTIEMISNPDEALALLQLYKKVCKRLGRIPESTVVFKLEHMHAMAQLMATTEIFCRALQKNVPKTTKRNAMLKALRH